MIIILLKQSRNIARSCWFRFQLQEQPENNLMVANSREWNDASYFMAANTIKPLELHYKMIQFLII